MATKKVAPGQKRLSSFDEKGSKVQTSGQAKQVKGKGAKSSTGSSVVIPPKITSKSGFDRDVEKKFDEMLAGDLNDLPHLPRSIVRIFLSSTFSDMRAERNMLARQVYPELRNRCAELELDFQVVDLRWGLTSETENDHSGAKVCLQEIKTCQHVSLGPNFVGILGQRYGMHRPLVVELPIEDFEILLAEAKSLNLPDVPLLETWYQKDDNAIPPVYVLQPIRTYYTHYGDMTPGKEKERRTDLEKWTDTQERLRHVCQTAMQSAYKAKKISEASWRLHFMSVTDHEIMSGIVQASSPEKHTLFFTRDFTDVTSDAFTQAMAEKCFDLVHKDGKLVQDTETRAMITDLVKKVDTKMGKDSRISLSVPWREGGIDPTKFQEHQAYISEFCAHFLDNVTNLISGGLDLREAKIRQREWYTMYNEVLHHLRFTNTKCESFCGQVDVLEKAKQYILDPSRRTPFVIHAPSGAGKTSVMAMIMKSLSSWLPGGHIGIIRFLGTSPLTLHVYNVLFGVCGQLADTTDILMERISYRSWKGLKAYAPRLIRRVSSILTIKLKIPAIILLDSLDQLAPSDDAYLMDWLPTVLPQNVKIIVSTLPKEHGILDRLQQLLPDPGCFYAVPLLPETTGKEIVHKYLKLRNRTVTDAQLSMLLKAFSSNPSPLYLKLLMDQAVKYSSFFTPDPASIPDTIRVAINALFDSLEVKFGKRLVQTALGLLTVGLNGLSDIEVEDALSCCDDALDEVYQFHDPPVPGIVRIPPVMWARISYELSEYLVERLSQGKTTRFWYHRQFIETAMERYISGKEGDKLHAVLFDMFCAENGVKRSITLRNRKNLLVKDADRQTTPQPLVASNVRKLEAVTHHLLKAKDLVSIDTAKSTVFANFRFLTTKMSALGADKVLEDLSDYLKVKKDDELACLKDFIESQRNSVANPRSFAFNVIARLDPSPSFKYLQDLKNQAENSLTTSDKPQLIPCMPCLAPRPGDPSLLLNGFTRVLDQAGDCLLLENESVDDEVSSFSIVNAVTSEVTDVLLEPGITEIKLTSGGQGYAYLSADSVKIVKSPSAKEISKGITELFKGGKIVPKTTESMGLNVSSEGSDLGLLAGAQAVVVCKGLTKPELFSVSKFDDCTIRCVIPSGMSSSLVVVTGDVQADETTHSFFAIWKSGSSKPEGIVELEGVIKHPLVSLTTEEEFVVSPMTLENDSHQLLIIQMQPFVALTPVTTNEISQLRVSSTQQVVAYLSDGTDIQFVDISKGKLEKLAHKTSVTDFDVVWEDDRVILADKDGQVNVYTRTGDVLLTFQGHSQGVAYLRFIGGSITILTCSGLVKGWDSAAVSSMMRTAGAAAATSGDTTIDSASLNYLADVINCCETGQELFTFSSNGTVSVWAMGSFGKIRSFSIGIKADLVLLAAFCLCVGLDKEAKKLKVFQCNTGDMVCAGVIPENVIACTLTSDKRSMLTLSEQPQLTLHIIQLEEKSGHVTKTLSIQLGYKHVTIDMKLTALERYVCLQVEIDDADYSKIEASWKKGNLMSQRHRCRFAAVDLSGTSGHALQCFRPLTKVPHLGVCMEPCSGNTMLLTTRRWVIFWDIPTGKCDQRISKSTRYGMFYRPSWLKDARGANICLTRTKGNKLLVAGSEDGYLIVYDMESGGPVGLKAPTSKHEAPVSHVCATRDGSIVVSACRNGVLKMWTTKTGAQVAVNRLGSSVRSLHVTDDGSYVFAVTQAERSRVTVFKLHFVKV